MDRKREYLESQKAVKENPDSPVTKQAFKNSLQSLIKCYKSHLEKEADVLEKKKLEDELQVALALVNDLSASDIREIIEKRGKVKVKGLL